MKKNVPVLCSNYPVVSKEPEYTVLSGESLTLDCSAETLQGTAKPQIHWLDQWGARVKGSGNTHTFTATSVQDNGQWTCVVTSKGTVSEGKISVSVAGEFERGYTVFQLTVILSFGSSSSIFFFSDRKRLVAFFFLAILTHIFHFFSASFYNH